MASPALFLLAFGLVVLSAAFHECGHATACTVGGAEPGRMGAGIYVAWPAFYTDVTDAYRLDRRPGCVPTSAASTSPAWSCWAWPASTR